MQYEPQDARWQRIKSFNIDEPGAVYSFSQKLAAQQNWSADYTQRAIHEYKKFIYLCCILSAGASPPPAVDEVWHLHLTYTKSYWQDFCRDTLQQDIHHNPSKGGNEEKEKYVSLYAETLTAYCNYFGEPSADIWPKPALIPAIHHFIDKYPEAPFFYGTKGFLLPVLWLLIPFVCSALLYDVAIPYDLSGPQFLVFFAMFGIAGIIAMLAQQFNKRQNLNKWLNSVLADDISVFAATQCFYGNGRLLRLCLLDLVTRGKLSVVETTENSFRVRDLTPGSNEQNPLLPALAATYTPGSSFRFDDVTALPLSNIPAAGRLTARLKTATKPIDLPALLVPGLVLAAGMLRILQGTANHKPVSNLFAECFGFLLITIFILTAFAARAHIMNNAARTWVRRNNEPDLLTDYSINGLPETALLAVPALFAVNQLFATPAPIKPFSTTSGNSSFGDSSTDNCGSSCGSSCGSGCGGCGGGD